MYTPEKYSVYGVDAIGYEDNFKTDVNGNI